MHAYPIYSDFQNRPQTFFTLFKLSLWYQTLFNDYQILSARWRKALNDLSPIGSLLINQRRIPIILTGDRTFAIKAVIQSITVVSQAQSALVHHPVESTTPLLLWLATLYNHVILEEIYTISLVNWFIYLFNII